MWTIIKNWFASQGGWAHGLVVIYLTLVGLYAGVPAFASLLNNIYGYIPSWGHEILLAAFGVIAFYAPTSSKKGSL